MSAAEARIDTAHAGRYLTQLCDHLDHMRHRSTAARPDPGGQGGGGHSPAGHNAPPGVRAVERADRRGEIVFDWGRCILIASDDALTVRAETSNEAALTRAKELIGRRIETIGHREHLTVTWSN
jgi:hypothetical protein